MISIIAKCQVKPETVNELKKLALDLVAVSRKEEGNISYNFYAEISDSSRFTFIEEWKDQEAIDIHMKTAHFQDFGAKAGPLFAGPLDIALYNKLS
ncbi:antibiotic biosynthesis monooxygenase [Methanogenium marinum]|uniref:Antibiotic biosynthesis monooxygenase n=1 Tax=Methanogenium marinum TaxID=348610 RepID=A0A9Q4KRL8_9EURY|nr:putative quinol monooxygenase [Methanogenium marinum]MDE4907412.1 antibiotic biosynthesis monooxygenase [Methanogenium marinum]